MPTPSTRPSRTSTIALAKSGEPFAAVAGRAASALPRRSTACINLVYTVEHGKRLYVERIDIHGNTKTRDDGDPARIRFRSKATPTTAR